MILFFKGGVGLGNHGHRGRPVLVGGRYAGASHTRLSAGCAGPLFLFHDDGPLKAHPDYRAAPTQILRCRVFAAASCAGLFRACRMMARTASG